MSFVVAIRIQLEGDAEIFREMIMQYREDCLANESGMEQFLICSIPDDENGFHYKLKGTIKPISWHIMRCGRIRKFITINII